MTMNLGSNRLPADGYYCKDASLMVQSLPPNSIDVTITSPPYGAMKDYGEKGQIGFGQTYDEYIATLKCLFADVLTRTKDSGSLWVVVDTFKEKSQFRLLPYDLAGSLVQVGWKLRDLIIWNKTKTLPWSRKGQFRKVFEYILFFSKSNSFNYFIERIKEPDDLKEWWVKYPERYSPEGKVPSTLWTYPIPVQGSWSQSSIRHFCPFPPALVERILHLTTIPGDLVFDPFAGSGTVLAQAKVMGRKFIGSDLNPRYRDHFLRVTSNHLSKRWVKELANNERIEGERQHLASTIKKLRQVKYPKTLFKELQRSLADAGDITAIVVKTSEEANSKHFSKLFIYLITEGRRTMMTKEARRLIKQAPLSKFGLSSEVHSYKPSEFFSSRDGALLKGQTLSVYLEGKTHFSADRVSLSGEEALSKKDWKRIPPIFIDVDVKQVPIKTWQSLNNGKHSSS
jgi:DNA modification methylase